MVRRNRGSVDAPLPLRFPPASHPDACGSWSRRLFGGRIDGSGGCARGCAPRQRRQRQGQRRWRERRPGGRWLHRRVRGLLHGPVDRYRARTRKGMVPSAERVRLERPACAHEPRWDFRRRRDPFSRQVRVRQVRGAHQGSGDALVSHRLLPLPGQSQVERDRRRDRQRVRHVADPGHDVGARGGDPSGGALRRRLRSGLRPVRRFPHLRDRPPPW